MKHAQPLSPHHHTIPQKCYSRVTMRITTSYRSVARSREHSLPVVTTRILLLFTILLISPTSKAGDTRQSFTMASEQTSPRYNLRSSDNDAGQNPGHQGQEQNVNTDDPAGSNPVWDDRALYTPLFCLTEVPDSVKTPLLNTPPQIL